MASASPDIGLDVGVTKESIDKLGSDVAKAAQDVGKKANLTLVDALSKDLAEHGAEAGSGYFSAFGSAGQVAVSALGSDTVLALGVVSAAAGVAIAGVAAGLSAALKFEGLQKVETQFDVLTQRAGVAGTALKDALSGAAKGTISEQELLQGANRALIELGTSAGKLPSIMEVARKATSVFGGDTIENFNGVVRAIESGQTRQLRSIGIFVDSDKAVREYARSLGVSTDALTQAGKQQAILNAVLAKGETSFSGIKSVAPLTIAMKQWKASIEDAAASLTKLVGGPLDKFLAFELQTDNKFFTFIKETFGSFDKASDAAARVSVLTARLSSLQAILAKPNISEGQFASVSFEAAQVQKQIDSARASIDRLKKDASLATKPAPTATSGSLADGTAVVDQRKVQGSNLQFAQELAQTRQEAAQIEGARIEEQQKALPNSIGIERARVQSISAISDNYYNQEAILRNKNEQDGVLTQTQLNEKVAALEELKTQKLLKVNADYQQKLSELSEQRISGLQQGPERDAAILQFRNQQNLLIESQYQQQLVDLRRSYQVQGLEGTQAEASAEVELRKRANDQMLESNKKFATQSEELSKQLGQAFKSGATSAIVSGVQTFVTALKNGQSGVKAFVGAAIGAFGQLAIQVGSVLIGSGLGIEALKATLGGAAVAVGIALVAVGTIAEAFSGNMTGSASSMPTSLSDSSGSTAATSAPSSTTTKAVPAPNIIINGNVLDNQQFKYTIQDLMTQHYRETGWSAAGLAS